MNKAEIIEQLKQENTKELFKEADKIREVYVGNEIHIRGIIEFSNYCCRSCFYCGLRQQNKNISRYRMSRDEIIKLANEISQLGVRTIVLQSGDDIEFSQKEISRIINRIKRGKPEIAITLSIGERPLDDYKAFKDAGADRYLLKHESANSELYAKFHPGQTLKRRLAILENLKKLGYQIGAGNIVGLPGQSLEDLAEDILLLKSLDVDMAGIGPFISQKDTPLANFPCGDLDLNLRVLALVRINRKTIHLPVTTALATLDHEQGQILGLSAGCNVIMPDFTPECYRRNYIIYDNKKRVNLEKAKDIIFKAGRVISKGRGDSPR